MTPAPFRLYVLDSCPFCIEAMCWMIRAQLPFEVVASQGDPIIERGIRSLDGELRYPILISYPTKELIVGFKENEYERVRAAYNNGSGPSPTNAAALAIEAPATAATAPIESQPATEST